MSYWEDKLATCSFVTYYFIFKNTYWLHLIQSKANRVAELNENAWIEIP